MKPGSARLPVREMSRSRPTRSSISGALGPGALVVPEDRRAEHAILCVEADETVHLAGEADSVDVDAEGSERSLARLQPVVGVLLGPARLRGGERIRLLRGRDDLTLRGDRDRLDAGRPDVQADEGFHSPPSAAYTSSYARTASFRCWASRSAPSSILAATESMNRQCRTLRFTAATASSVYG